VSVEIYVYYKVDEANLDAALLAFEQASAALSGPRPRLLRRQESDAGTQTWMEIHYGADPLAAAQQLSEAMTPYISGARHVERFLPLR
jgi:hypothetical protein